MKWRILGAGSYNVAYRSEDGNFVFKVSQDNSPTDLPERSVRLWNLINSHIHPPAYVTTQIINGRKVKGWVCPFVRGVQANDEEMRKGLLDIFNRSGRIITDAPAPNNFKKTRDGKIVCIDFGHALEMEKRESAGLVGLTRKPSFTSLEAWEDIYAVSTGQQWLTNAQNSFPKTIKTIKALLFIKQHRPDISRVDFLKKSPQTITELAKAYDSKKKSTRRSAVELLNEKCSPDLENTKKRCRNIFLEYLARNGTMDAHERFIPNDPETVDTPHIQRAIALMRQINIATSCEECDAIVGAYVAESAALYPELITSAPEVQPKAILPEISQPKTTTMKQDNDWFKTLEDLIDEVNETMALSKLKEKCQTILEGYIMTHGGWEEGDDTGLVEGAGPTIFHYKSQMRVNRLTEQVEKLIQQIELSISFVELQNHIESALEKLPVAEKNSDTPDSLSDLSASLMMCRLLTISAQSAQSQSRPAYD